MLSPANMVFGITSSKYIQKQIWDRCLEASEDSGRTAGGRGFITGMGSTAEFGDDLGRRMDMELRLAPLRQGLKQAGLESLELLFSSGVLWPPTWMCKWGY